MLKQYLSDLDTLVNDFYCQPLLVSLNLRSFGALLFRNFLFKMKKNPST